MPDDDDDARARLKIENCEKKREAAVGAVGGRESGASRRRAMMNGRTGDHSCDVQSLSGLSTINEQTNLIYVHIRKSGLRTYYMQAHAAEVRQGTNADGKAMLQRRAGGRERERKGGRNVSNLHSDLSQRHGDHAGFPISMAQLVGPHSINLLHFLLGLRRAEWNIEPA